MDHASVYSLKSMQPRRLSSNNVRLLLILVHRNMLSRVLFKPNAEYHFTGSAVIIVSLVLFLGLLKCLVIDMSFSSITPMAEISAVKIFKICERALLECGLIGCT